MTRSITVFFCLLIAAITLNAAPSAKNNDGKCFLSNDLVDLVIDTKSGGRVESFSLKDKKLNISELLPAGAAPGGSGIGFERFYSKGCGIERKFESSEYEVKKCSANTQEAIAELTCELNGLRFTKTYILKAGRSSLEIQYQFANMRNSNITGHLWMGSVISPSDSDKTLNVFYPFGLYTESFGAMSGSPQVTQLRFPLKDKNAFPYMGNNTILFPADAWSAVVSDLGNGAAFEFDYPDLDRFYSFMPQGATPGKMTMETLSIQFELMPLQKGIALAAQRPELSDPLADYIYKFNQVVIPLCDMKTVGGVADGISADIEFNGVNAELSFEADRSHSGLTAELSLFAPDGKKIQNAESGKFDLLPATLKKVSVPLKNPGDFIALMNLKDENQNSIAKIRIIKVSNETAQGLSGAPASAKNKKFSPKIDSFDFNRNFADTAMPWGKDIGNKINIVALFPIAAHREIAELERRLNCKISPVETDFPHVFNFSTSSFCDWEAPQPEELLPKRFEEKKDVMLIGGSVLWDKIPPRLQEMILDKVSNGMGLVYFTSKRSAKFDKLVQKEKIPYSIAGMPFRQLPVLKKYSSISDFVECGKIGKGRVVMITYDQVPKGLLWRVGPRGVLPNIEDDSAYKFNYWEYFFSIAAKALRYASGNDPDTYILSSNKNETVIESRKKIDDGLLETEVYDKNGQLVFKDEKKVKILDGKNIVKYDIPEKCLNMAGFYIVNSVLKAGKETLDWFSSDFTPDNAATIRNFALDSLSFGEAGSPVKGYCDVSCIGKLTLTLKDCYSRILARKDIETREGRNDFSFENYILPLSQLCTVDARFESAGKTDIADACLTLKLTPENDVRFIIWGSGESQHWTRRILLSRLEKMGYTSYTGSGFPPKTDFDESRAITRKVMQSGLEYFPMGLHRLAVTNKDDMKKRERTPCLRSPEYRDAVEKDYSKAIERFKDFHLFYYYVADENSLGHYSDPHDFCTSKYCLPAFIEEMKKKYVTIENLNNAWKTSFAKWEDVMPSTFAEAQKSGNWGSWLEHRNFMFGTFANAFSIQKETLNKMVPGAGMCISGMGEPLIHNGFDWQKLQESIDISGCYFRESGRIMDPVRSFARPSSYLGQWSGYGMGQGTYNWQYWHEIANRCFAPAFWCSNYFIKHGDESPSTECEPVAASIHGIRETGIGKLVMESKWVNSEVGALYSTPSLIATARSGADSVLSNNFYNANLDGWSGLLRDSGFQPPQYFTPEQLEAGKLDPAKTPVFLLMLAQAMTDKTFEVLKDYVEKGGILIADAVPAIWDINGIARNKKELAAFFGCNYSLDGFGKSPLSFSKDGKTLPIKPANGNIKVTGGKSLIEARKQNVDIKFGSIEVASREASVGTVPGMILTRHGKGAVIYMNTTLENYEASRAKSLNSEPVQDVLLSVLKNAGVKVPDFKLPSGTEVVRHKLGNVTIFVMTRIPRADKNDSSKFKLVIPESSVVYDVRNKTHKSGQKEISGEIQPGDAKVFAISPEALKDFDFNAEIKNGIISFSLAADKNQPRVFHLEILDGSGKCVRHYSHNFRVDGIKKDTIALGIGEFHGKITIRATDVITGESKEIELK